MDKLVGFLVFLLICSIFAIIAPALKKNISFQWLFILSWSFVLSIFVAFYYEYIPFIFSDQKETVALLTENASLETKEKLLNKLKNNFIIVDVSYDKELVQHPDYNDEQSKVSITDRNKLGNLLQHIDSLSDNIDLVVLDILFDIETSHDSILIRSLEHLETKNKLVVAWSPNYELNKNLNLKNYGNRTFGDVSENPIDHKFVKHQLIRNEISSLPYAVYCHINNIERSNYWIPQLSVESNGEKKSVILNHFIPIIGLSSQEIIPPLTYNTEINSNKNGIATISKNPIPFFQLWQTIISGSSGGMQEKFDSDFQKTKHSTDKNIVFIGSFSDEQSDIHSTLNGDMQGSMILLNIILNLMFHYHHNVFLYFFTLWFSFALIIFLIIRRSFYYKKKLSGTSSNKFLIVFKRVMKFIFIDEIHYWLMLIMTAAFYFFENRIVNIMFLFMHFFLLEVFFKTFGTSSASNEELEE